MINDNNDSLHGLKDLLDTVINTGGNIDYPSQSLPMGTYIRSHRYDRLGIVVDSFYGDVDKDGKKIIVYTVLLFPDNRKINLSYSNSDQFYLSNEYEYEITAYLMLAPIDMRHISHIIGGNL